MGKQWKQWETLILGAPRSLQMMTTTMKLKDACSFEEKLCQTYTNFLKVETLLCWKFQYNQSYDFSSCHVWMWQLHHKEWWAMNNWWFWTLVLDKSVESALDCKETHPVILNEINPEYSLEGLMLKLKLQYFGHLDVKNWLIRKDPDAGKDWKQEDKGTTDDEIVVWHHWLDGHMFEQAPGVGNGQGSLCAAVHGVAKDQTRLRNWTDLNTRVEMEKRKSMVTELLLCSRTVWMYFHIYSLA